MKVKSFKFVRGRRYNFCWYFDICNVVYKALYRTNNWCCESISCKFFVHSNHPLLRLKNITITIACKEMLWMRKFVKELDRVQEHYICDGQSVIYVRIWVFILSLTHIDLRYRWIWVALEMKLLKLEEIYMIRMELIYWLKTCRIRNKCVARR